MTRRSSKIPKAIPTLFKGVKYKSRLEARFAEWMDEGGWEFLYEPLFPGNKQKYTPDFLLSHLGLYIEVKPIEFLDEMNMFMDEIRDSGVPWICVDRMERDSWFVIRWNLIAERVSFEIPYSRLEIQKDRIRLYPEFVDRLLLNDSRQPDLTPPVDPPASEESAKAKFAKIRELVGLKEA